MGVAIYSCDWLTASVPFKKMVIHFLIQSMRPIGIDLKPFYHNLNLMALAKVEE